LAVVIALRPRDVLYAFAFLTAVQIVQEAWQ
jgi:hypothetical protein